jgi:hypothetical protein
MNYNVQYDNENMDVTPKLVYTGTINATQIWAYVKIIAFYILELVAWILIARAYAAFGTKLITPMVSAMYIVGAFTTWYIKEDRESTIKSTKWMVAGYLGALLVYRIVIKLAAPVTSDQMSVALNIPIPGASGLAAAGFFQNILWILAIMFPVGFVFMCGKKFVLFHGKQTKEEAFRRAKGLRKNRKRF